MKWLLYTAYVPALIWMFIISGFSGTGGEQSSGVSLRVTECVVDVIDAVTFTDSYTEEERADMIELLHTPVRKAAHMAEYAILFILIAIPTLLIHGRTGIMKKMLIVMLLCVIYASSDEIHQLYVEGREGKVTDVLVDTVGSVLGLVVVCGINKLADRKVEGKCKQ